MNRYFVEIVERAFDRFTWVLVVYRKRRRRVVARAARDYRTPDKAVQAARRLQRNLPYAQIVSPFPTTPDFTFRILQDAVPLPVGSPEDAEEFHPAQQAVFGRPGAAVAARPAPTATAVGAAQPAAAQVAPGAALAGASAAPAAQGASTDQAASDAGTTPPTEEEKPRVRQSRARKQAAPRTPRRRGAAATARS